MVLVRGGFTVKGKADKALRAVLNRSGRTSKDAASRTQLSDKVKAAVKALRKERQLSDEQLNRRATL